MTDEELYLKADKLFFEKGGVPTSMKPGMTQEQLREIFINKLKAFATDPYKNIINPSSKSPVYGTDGSVAIVFGDESYIIITNGYDGSRPRHGDDYCPIKSTDRMLNRVCIKSTNKFYMDVEYGDELVEFVFEAKKQKRVFNPYVRVENLFRRADVDLPKNLKYTMSQAQAQQTTLKAIKDALEWPNVILERNDNSTINIYGRWKAHDKFANQDYTGDSRLAKVNINQNSQEYGEIVFANLEVRFTDKSFADYLVKEYDRLSKVERINKIAKPKPEPKPEPKKKESLFDKFIGFFKGNSKS